MHGGILTYLYRYCVVYFLDDEDDGWYGLLMVAVIMCYICELCGLIGIIS